MNDKSVIVQPGTANIFISPVAFLQYSRDYYDASCAYKPDKKYSPAKYYLVCRALELALKAFLCSNGIAVKDIKYDLGHDLEKILIKSDEKNIFPVIQITDNEREQITKANAWYARKGFEYFDVENLMVGWDSLPDLELLSALNLRLINALKPICMEASKK